MPDTKIRKTLQGWIDVDNPATVYPVRRLARNARRTYLVQAGLYKKPVRQTQPVTARAIKVNTVTTATVLGYQPGPGQQQATLTLTGLHKKLYDRLTNDQGVSATDAMEVLTDPHNGYNKCASYGHMREAGANHAEAKIVIALDNPTVSMSYGISRAQGMNHTDALNKALKDDGN